MLSKFLRVVPALSLIALGAFVYANSLHVPFLFDDGPNIVEEPRIRHLWPLDWLAVNPLRPVVYLTLAANYAVGGMDVRGYHVFNITVHVAAALCLFGLVRRTLLVGRLKDRYGESATGLALATAAIWLVHPLQTESVTYVVHRGESLMGLCFLACLYCLVRGEGSTRSWAWYAGSVLACWVGLGSKEVMAAAPLVMIVYDRVFLAADWWEIWWKRKWLYAGIFLCFAWFLPRLIAPLFEYHPAAGFGMPGITATQYAETQTSVVLHYLQLAFWPQAQCIDYAWPVVSSFREVIAPTVFWLVALSATSWAWRRRPAFAFLGIAFFAILAPTSSIVPIADLAVERRMYLPLACLVVLTVIGVDAGIRACGRSRAWPVMMRTSLVDGLAILAVAVLSCLTLTRNGLYADPIGMWTEAIETNPRNPRAHYNLAVCLGRKGQSTEAFDHYRRALEIEPNYVEAMNNLGLVLNEGGKFDEAAALFRRAIERRPQFTEAHANLANDLVRRGDFEAARAELERALALSPRDSVMARHIEQTMRELPQVVEIDAATTSPGPAIGDLPGVLPGLGR